jgi:septal ring factor EnvC (AmiA/AmiB activator)
MQDQENATTSSEEQNSLQEDNKTEEGSVHVDYQTESDLNKDAESLSMDGNDEDAEPESRKRKVFRKVIRWSLGLIIIFGLGFLTAVFSIYNPTESELENSKNKLENAENTIGSLETEISEHQRESDKLKSEVDVLNQTITDLETENQKLVDSLYTASLQIELLKARNDVLRAQVELYQENPAQARVLLDSTQKTLIRIETLLPEDIKAVVAPLQNRLDLAIGEIENDPETAIADLGILAGDLLEIENALYKE